MLSCNQLWKPRSLPQALVLLVQLHLVNGRHRHVKPEIRINSASESGESASDPCAVRSNHRYAPPGFVCCSIRRADCPHHQRGVTLAARVGPLGVLPAVPVVGTPMGGRFDPGFPFAKFRTRIDREAKRLSRWGHGLHGPQVRTRQETRRSGGNQQPGQLVRLRQALWRQRTPVLVKPTGSWGHRRRVANQEQVEHLGTVAAEANAA